MNGRSEAGTDRQSYPQVTAGPEDQPDGERVATWMRPSRYARNWGLGLLFVTGSLNLFDRQIVNILAQDIKADLAISDTELGLLTGTAFALFYSFFGLPLGRLADRVNRVKLIAAALFVWSGFTGLCGFAHNYLTLFVARLGVGIGEAGSQPASTSLIPDFFPEERRVSAMSVLLFGAPVGSFLGFLIGGEISAAWGWRMAFVVAAIPGIILALIMILTMGDPRPRPLVTRGGASAFRSFRSILAESRFRKLVMAGVCGSFLAYGSGAWLPVFFIRAHGMTTAQIGWTSALAIGVGGGIGTLCAGLLCDRLRRYWPDIESRLIMAMFAFSVPTILVTILSADVNIGLVAFFLFSLCAYGWLAPTISLIQKSVSNENRALSVAINSALSNILGLGVGMPLVGAASDALTPAYGDMAVGYALAGGMILAAALGLIAHRSLRSQGAGPSIANPARI